MTARKCPTCGRTYIDETLSFCLEDGAPLLFEAESSEPTTAILRDRGNTTEGETRIFDESARASGGTARKHATLLALGGTALLVAVGIIAYVYFSGFGTGFGSIAVLPLKNETGSAESDYLSDGITELLIGRLSQIPQLSVKARSSVFRYKGTDASPSSVAGELKVDTLLLGRVGKAGDRLVFSLELVDARTENVIWSDQYIRDPTRLTDLQNDIASDVAEKLRAKLSGADQQRFQRKDTANSEAYENYLRGRFHWNTRSRDGLERSVEYFNRAIAADPSYARAYSALADTYALMPFYAGTDPKDSFAKLRAAATRATEIDPGLAEPHAALGFIKMWYDFDGVGAESAFRRAVELNPSYATGHHWFALFLATRGRHVESLAEIDRAFELDPFSVGINLDIGVINFYARRYDEAEAQLQKTLEMDPKFLQIYLFYAETLEQKQNFEEAADTWVQVVKIAGGDSAGAAALKPAFKSGGAEGFYREKLNLLLQRWQRRGEGAFNIAEVYARLGEKEKSFEWLRRSVELRELALPTLRVTPGFDSIRTDPRYLEIQGSAGLD